LLSKKTPGLTASGSFAWWGVEPPAGIEPATCRLQGRATTLITMPPPRSGAVRVRSRQAMVAVVAVTAAIDGPARDTTVGTEEEQHPDPRGPADVGPTAARSSIALLDQRCRVRLGPAAFKNHLQADPRRVTSFAVPLERPFRLI